MTGSRARFAITWPTTTWTIPLLIPGNFIVGPADQLYGPYPSGDSDVKVGDNVIPRPMKNSVGMVPVFGAQVGESKVCASCHTIVLPVFDANGNQVTTAFEQTTYLEWLNSSFASQNQTCQNCHMPDNFKGEKLAFQIANIEDSTFPGYQRLVCKHRCRLTN